MCSDCHRSRPARIWALTPVRLDIPTKLNLAQRILLEAMILLGQVTSSHPSNMLLPLVP
jgi:hypothetical protein